jgi:hypothetical protein
LLTPRCHASIALGARSFIISRHAALKSTKDLSSPTEVAHKLRVLKKAGIGTALSVLIFPLLYVEIEQGVLYQM